MCIIVFPSNNLIFMSVSAEKTDSGGMSVQEHSPGANEGSAEAFYKHLQSGELIMPLVLLSQSHHKGKTGDLDSPQANNN